MLLVIICFESGNTFANVIFIKKQFLLNPSEVSNVIRIYFLLCRLIVSSRGHFLGKMLSF